MKYLIVLCSVLLLFASCRKKKQVIFRFYGYVYNSIDSTPFSETQLKLYEPNPTNIIKFRESFFTTDDDGYFDISNNGEQGKQVAWPSYSHISPDYVGPPSMRADSSTSEFGDDKVIHTMYFDTLYTVPYY
jgi:hypothetical protein